MDFPYAAILRKAYSLTRTNFQLWVLGVFLSLAMALNLLIVNLVMDKKKIVDFQLPDMGALLEKLQSLLHSPLGIANILIIAVILFLSALSKATVIWSGQKLAGGEPAPLKTALREAKRFVWPVLLLQIVLLFLFVVLFVSVAAPVVYLAVIQEIGRAVALTILGLAILVPVSVLLILMFLYSPIFVVLYKVPAATALGLAFSLAQNKLKESLILAAFLAGIGLIFMTLLVFSIIVVSVPIAFLSLLLAQIGLVWAIYSLIFITAFVGLCAVVILSAGFTIFTNLVWVLAVMEMVKTEKTDEKAQVLAPEAEPAA